MPKWPTSPLADVCESISYGYTASAQATGPGPQFLRITDIAQGPLDWRTVPFCEADDSQVAKYALRHGDIVVARTGATVGHARWLNNPPSAVFASYLVRMRIDREHSSRFMGYLIESGEYKSFIQQHAGGAAQPNANAKVLTSFPVPVPPRRDQDRIAAVLWVLDKLIKDNRRRVEILEETSRSMYREWFIRYQFPGHESSELVDSPVGPVPAMWVVGKLGSCIELNPSSVNPSTWEEVRYLDISAVGDRALTWPTGIPGPEAPGRARRLVQDGDVVHAMVRPNRRAHALIVDPPASAVASTGLAVLRPRGVPSAFLFELVSDTAFTEYLVGRATGAAYPAVKPNDFAEAVVAFPSLETLQGFASQVEPLHRLAAGLSTENVTLGAARDALLPRLVTGEIGIESLRVDDVFGWADLASAEDG